MKKPVIIFFLVNIFFILFFYFYPANIFEYQEISEWSNDIEVKKEITLKEILSNKFQSNKDKSITLKSWFFILIIFIGLPSMIAWRTTIKTYTRWKKN